MTIGLPEPVLGFSHSIYGFYNQPVPKSARIKVGSLWLEVRRKEWTIECVFHEGSKRLSPVFQIDPDTYWELEEQFRVLILGGFEVSHTGMNSEVYGLTGEDEQHGSWTDFTDAVSAVCGGRPFGDPRPRFRRRG